MGNYQIKFVPVSICLGSLSSLDWPSTSNSPTQSIIISLNNIENKNLKKR